MGLWVEESRPSLLNAVVLSDENRQLFEKCIREKEIPHLLLYGGSGTGKTTVARILVKALDAESMELNASDERGIDVIREKVKRFMMISTIKTWKVVFFDEADALTSPAQFSLRNLMETFSQQSRLIFSVNYIEKIIEPIRSRFQVVHFGEVSLSSQIELLKKVLEKENVIYEEDDLLKLVEDCQGDLRRVINEAQKLTSKGKFTYKTVRDLVDVEKLWKWTKEKRWTDIRQELSNGIDSTYILKRIFNYVFEEISPETAATVVGEYMWRDSFISDKELNVLCALIELGRHVS